MGLTVFCYSQSAKDYSIYVGKVEGVTKTQFIDAVSEGDIWSDSLLQLVSIVKSNYPIEIRLYENVSAMAVASCTTLFYDTAFHVTRILKAYNGWEKEYNAKAYYPLENINADTAFNEMVKNGIFSLPEFGTYDSSRKVLTPQGFIKNGALCGVTDGFIYTIQVKVHDVYKMIYFSSNDKAQLRCYPDNDIIRRKMNVVNQLKPNAIFVKKII